MNGLGENQKTKKKKEKLEGDLIKCGNENHVIINSPIVLTTSIFISYSWKNQSRRGVVIVTNKNMEQAEERKEVDGPWTNGIQKPKQLHR